jgi:uncharacterized coiled-coil protein SlyX
MSQQRVETLVQDIMAEIEAPEGLEDKTFQYWILSKSWHRKLEVREPLTVGGLINSCNRLIASACNPHEVRLQDHVIRLLSKVISGRRSMVKKHKDNLIALTEARQSRPKSKLSRTQATPTPTPTPMSLLN